LSLDGISVVDAHWIKLNPASAADLHKQVLAATSAAGVFDVYSSGSDAFFTYQTP